MDKKSMKLLFKLLEEAILKEKVFVFDRKKSSCDKIQFISMNGPSIQLTTNLKKNESDIWKLRGV